MVLLALLSSRVVAAEPPIVAERGQVPDVLVDGVSPEMAKRERAFSDQIEA